MNNSILTCSLLTLGCKVNQYEIDEMASKLSRYGVIRSTTVSDSNITIINTCSVTSMSDKKSRQMIRRIKKENPSTFLVVTGCYAQSEPERILRLEGVNLVIPNKSKDQIVNIIANKIGLKRVSSAKIEKPKRVRRLVKIVDGCNSFCSYCIIPHLRGGVSSRTIQEIASEFEKLESAGTKEIILTGINLGRFGYDLNEPSSVSSLLQELAKKKRPDTRIRLSSIEVNDVDKTLIKMIGNGIVCRHLHIPLQSGSDKMLRSMNRKYDLQFFANKIAEIRETVPDIAITTDVIVGYPGETDDDYNKTVAAIGKLGFSKVHVFKFSRREGTIAADLEDQIDEHVKQGRSNRLISIQEELADIYVQKFVDKKLGVLIESRTKLSGKSCAYGLTSNYLKIHVPNYNGPINSIVDVKINEIRGSLILGTVN